MIVVNVRPDIKHMGWVNMRIFSTGVESLSGWGGGGCLHEEC